MKRLAGYIFFFGCFFCLSGCNTQKNEKSILPSDKKATKETIELFSSLNARMEKGIMLGHQDDLAYGNKWYGEPGRSDVKALCGDYPAVFAWNIGNFETDSVYNSDSISFSKLKNYIAMVNKLKGISIFTWTAHNPIVNHALNQTEIHSAGLILKDKSVRDKYLTYLDKVAGFFNSLKDKDGNSIPVVFEPFNEYNLSGKYWWSVNQCTATEFKSLWIFTVNYLRNTKNIHNVLYSYSIYADTCTSTLSDYYPGNEYVDLVGVSLYLYQEKDPTGKSYVQTLNSNLSIITQFAEKNNKIAALTSTGMEGIKIPDYFSNYLYPIVSQYKLSYIMFGKNSWNDEKYYFIPIPGHPASEDFEIFSKNPRILTCSRACF